MPRLAGADAPTRGGGRVRVGVGLRGIPDVETSARAQARRMSTLPATSRVHIGAALVAGAAAQFVDDAVYIVLPPAALLAPFSGLIAVLLTAAAARVVTRNRTGAAVARTGLAVGATSAALGLLVGG